MKSLAPNTLLQNRYLIIHLIGKGGMGEVYLAVDQRLGSAMALKRTFFNDDEVLKTAFEQEAKTLARLRHPALPKVSDHFTENDVQYLVMEHISGDDLSKRLEAAKQPFPLSWVLFWADQLLDALAYLHGHEPPIIHRDIKPQNLKLTTDNQIILLDFGLAKNSIGETRHSTSGTLSGYTPHYASMEQIRGTGTTAQSDIYSLSATLYQLLTNTVPPDALARADNALNSLPDPVKSLSEVNQEVSPLISDVILKGFSLSAEKRYKNAREMQTALREAYDQMQKGMAAQTVAFNVSDTATPSTDALPQSQMKTEMYSAPLVSQPQTNVSQPLQSDYDVFSSQQTSEDIHIPVVQEQNFDATVKYDGPIANLKSEAYNAPAIGEKTEVLPYDISSLPKTPEEFVPPTNEPVKTDHEVFDAGATIPLISFSDDIIGAQPSNQTEVMNFADVPQDVPSQVDMRTESLSKEEIMPREEVKTEAAVVNSTPKKKSSGKVFIIIGILLLLGFLGIGAAGIGLYLYNPSILTDLTGGTKPTPSPSIEPSVTPTEVPSPTPTPDSTPDTNTNNPINNGGLTNTDNTGNTKPTETPTERPTPADKSTPDKSTPRPTPSATRPVPTPTKPIPTPTKPTPTTTRNVNKIA